MYVYATRNIDGGAVRNQILRYRDRDGRGVGRRVMVSNANGATSHNGGRILFGPDGMLYAIVGDAVDAANAQDLSNEERGKILRLRPGGGVPNDNPFDDRVYAYGIRNSFGFAFDPETDVLWETENGPECNDEVNVVESGRNYGWGPNETCSGNAPENTNQDGPNPVLPATLYQATIGITGIAFCDGCGLGPQSEGAAFHGAVTNARITRLTINQARDGIASREVVANAGGGPCRSRSGRRARSTSARSAASSSSSSSEAGVARAPERAYAVRARSRERSDGHRPATSDHRDRTGLAAAARPGSRARPRARGSPEPAAPPEPRGPQGPAEPEPVRPDP